jgi:anti-sigma regulatory factor (Ser/Thr protein kinase)
MYDTPDALLEAAVPFVEGGLLAGEVVVVQVPEHTWSLLKPQLASTQHIMLDPLNDVYGHAHQTLWGLKQLVEDEVRDGATAVRALAEIPPTRLASDYADWGRTEALLNTALGRVGYWGLCPYSRNDLSSDVIDMAVRTHPWLVDSGIRQENPAFEPTRDYLTRVDSVRATDPLEATPPTATQTLMSMSDLTAARGKLEEAFKLTRLSVERKADLSDALFEVAVNVMLYGGEVASVHLWVAKDHILCRVRDSGLGLTDPLAGYQPPDRRVPGAGLGLWSARQLCDTVTTTMEPAGFTVRLSVGF